jgi:Tfp pilus assembly protein PilN
VITKLNLATNPFRNRNLPYILALLLLAITVAGALLAIERVRDNNSKIELTKENIARMDGEIKRLRGEGEKASQELSPDQKAILVASHKLVASKSFGWSRLFADLEAVLPGSVSASRIEVQNIYKDGERIKAELEFSVLSRDYPAVMEMIGRMNNSGIFQAELRGQDLQKNERITFTEYTLRLIYSPAYGYAAAPPTQIAQNGQGGDQ